MDKTWHQLSGYNLDEETTFVVVPSDLPAVYFNFSDALTVNTSLTATYDPAKIEVTQASFTACSGVSSAVLNDPYKVVWCSHCARNPSSRARIGRPRLPRLCRC